MSNNLGILFNLISSLFKSEETNISTKSLHKKRLKELRIKKLEQKMKLNILKRKQISNKSG